MKYHPIRLQIAFFLSAVDFTSKFKIAALVRESAGNLLDVDPLLLPLGADSPPDFPHIIIRNESKGWAFQMAPARFDLAVELDSQQRDGNRRQLTEVISTTALSIWNGLKTGFGARAHRLGLITTIASEMENAPEALRQRFLNTVYGSGAHETQLHFLHKLENEGFSLNRWVRLKALPANETWPARLVMEVDINTVAEQPIEVTDSAIQKFLSVADQQTQQTIRDYLAE